MTATLGISVRHDNDALICAFAFAPGSAPQPIETLGAVSDAFERHCGGFVWVHVNLSHTGAQPWLERHAGVGPVFFEALTEGSRSTRIECDGDMLFGVMNDVTFDFSFDPSDVATLWISVSPERVVTARRRPLRSVDRLRTALRRGDRIETSVELLDHLLRDQADELQRIVRSAAERLDDIEDALLAGRHGEFNTELGRLRRLTVRLQRLLAPEPSALARTLSSPPSWVRAEDLQALHRSNEEFTLVLRDVVRSRTASVCCWTNRRARVRGEQPQPVHADHGHRDGATDQSDRGSAGHERRAVFRWRSPVTVSG